MASYFKQNLDLTDSDTLLECMQTFSKRKEKSLNAQEFDAMARTLLTDENNKPNELPVTVSAELFTIFDRNRERKIKEEEFQAVWDSWIKLLLHPVSALIIIDVQNDFIDGSLALKNCPAKQDGSEVVPVINDMLQTNNFGAVVYSLDFHPENHISFFENLKLYKLAENFKPEEVALFDTVVFKDPVVIKQKLWPRHCVENSWGSKLHEDLKIEEDAIFIYKGRNSGIDSYSAFRDNVKQSTTNLNQELKNRGITHVFICGLALDFCVAYTALDALELGYATVVVENATRGTDNNIIEKMKRKLLAKHCVITSSDNLEHLLKGKNIKTEFAISLGKRFERESGKENK
ncbi:nicotinamidase-like [Uloborus diversus]|uniref:nicotinamidase-like n=1 Tax=Uloborus diversus TaxID=327109 RepID=UPI002409E1BF|nr:nicotinamidase-like [Uloborus diversus]